MNESENRNEMGMNPGTEELQGELSSLRALVAVALLLVILLSLCADYFLSKQLSLLRAGISQAQMTVESFNGARAEDFLNKLKEYSKTHPDFIPIRDKYAPMFGTQTPPPAPAKK